MPVNAITLSEARDLHLSDLHELEGLARGTRGNYSSAYNTADRYLSERLGRQALTTDLTLDNIKDYFRGHVAVKSPKSFQPRHSNMILIIEWLMENGYMEYGPNAAKRIKKKRSDAVARPDRCFTDQEMKLLLDAARKSHERDYYLLLVAWLTGRRICELTGDTHDQRGLTWSDIKWEEDRVRWDNNKGRQKGKYMPMTAQLRAVLEAWKETYAEMLGVASPLGKWMVFPTLKPTGRSDKGFRRRRVLSPEAKIATPSVILNSLCLDAGVPHDKGDVWRILRRTAANALAQAVLAMGRGDSLPLAQQMLGHKNLATTELYMNRDIKEDHFVKWRMENCELSAAAMLRIPELAHLVPKRQLAASVPAVPAPTSHPRRPHQRPSTAHAGRTSAGRTRTRTHRPPTPDAPVPIAPPILPVSIDEPAEDGPLAEVIDFGSRLARRALG